MLEEEADLQRDKEGHRQDHEDTANLQSGEVDPQGVVAALREGEVNPPRRRSRSRSPRRRRNSDKYKGSYSEGQAHKGDSDHE